MVESPSLLNAKDVLKPGSTPFDVTWKTHEGDQEPKKDIFFFFPLLHVELQNCSCSESQKG